MADDLLQPYAQVAPDLFERAAKNARDLDRFRAFFDDEQFASWDDVFRLFDRTQLLTQLKGLLGQEHSAADWATPKLQMEYLAGLERDVRAYRRTRLDRYRAASQAKTLLKTTLAGVVDEVGRIASQQTT